MPALLKKSIASGDRHAAIFLFNIIQKKDVSKERAKVVDALRSAADRGFPHAQYVLARVIDSNIVPARFPDEAMELLNKAERQKCQPAISMLKDLLWRKSLKC